MESSAACESEKKWCDICDKMHQSCDRDTNTHKCSYTHTVYGHTHTPAVQQNGCFHVKENMY